jgi:hypothetical protein
VNGTILAVGQAICGSVCSATLTPDLARFEKIQAGLFRLCPGNIDAAPGYVGV